MCSHARSGLLRSGQNSLLGGRENDTLSVGKSDRSFDRAVGWRWRWCWAVDKRPLLPLASARDKTESRVPTQAVDEVVAAKSTFDFFFFFFFFFFFPFCARSWPRFETNHRINQACDTSSASKGKVSGALGFSGTESGHLTSLWFEDGWYQPAKQTIRRNQCPSPLEMAQVMSDFSKIHMKVGVVGDSFVRAAGATEAAEAAEAAKTVGGHQEGKQLATFPGKELRQDINFLLCVRSLA